MNVLRNWLKIQLKKVFMKKKKKVINVLTIFFIFHKNNIKIFLKLIVVLGLRQLLAFSI